MNSDTYFSLLLQALKNGDVKRKTLISGPHVGSEALYSGFRLLAGDCREESGEILEEMLQTDVELVVCGGGHIALELVAFASRLGYRVTVIDEREQYCNPKRFPSATCLCLPFEQALEAEHGWIRPYFVIATRGHSFDQLCLEKILSLNHRYVGMIGSKAKVATTLGNLKERGFSQAQLDSVHTPIGLSINAVTAGEIAVSILAQIIQTARTGASVVHLDRNLLVHLANTTQKFCLVRVIAKRGSAPCEVGFQLAVFEDGTVEGTVGGGAVEAKAIEDAETISSNTVIEYDLSNSKASELGMICGGSVRLLFQLW